MFSDYLHKIFLIVSFGLLAISCNTTGPPIEDIPPGKSDYIWSIDSVDYGNLPGTIQLESIWGSSASDVWGANGDAPDVRDCLWHYDGVKWARATEGTPITEFTGNKVVYSVWGTAQNNVWAFGRKINQGTLSAFIMHYNGSQWIDVTPASVASLSAHLYCVYGTAENNIWVGGYEYALHYNGTNWNTYKVADSIIVGSISGNDKFIYANGYSPWGKNIQLIYLFSNNSFYLIDQTTDQELKFAGMLWVNSGKINSFINGMVSTNINSDGTIDKSGWHRIFTTPTFFTERYVQSCKNVFAVGQWNLVYHFNGTDWAKIDINVPNHTVDPYAIFWGAWTDGNEVFISDTENGIIYHGR
jgi:hypothetical protein